MPVKVTDVLSPTAPTDAYPTHDSQYGKGGHMEVATIALRDAIPSLRRRFGMQVYVAETNVTYTLQADLTTWQAHAQFAWSEKPWSAVFDLDFSAEPLQQVTPLNNFQVNFTNLAPGRVVTLRLRRVLDSYFVLLPQNAVWYNGIPATIFPGQIATFSFTSWGTTVDEVDAVFASQVNFITP